MHDNLFAVHVALLRVTENAALAVPELASRLQENERRKLSRLHRTIDQLNFAAGRLLARKLLTRVIEAPAHGWFFDQTPLGKAVLPWPEAANIDFSIAHAAGMVAVAVCQGSQVGIDVENTSTSVDQHGIAEMCFRPAEAKRLREEPDHRKSDLFFSLWVVKEACGKAQQTGLSGPMCDLSAHLDALAAQGPAVFHLQDWRIRRSRPTAEHLLAVAVREHDSREMAWKEDEVSLQELLERH